MFNPAEFIEHRLRSESRAKERRRSAIAQRQIGRPHPRKEFIAIPEYLTSPGRDFRDLQHLLGNDTIEALLPLVALNGPFRHRKQLGHLSDRHGKIVSET